MHNELVGTTKREALYCGHRLWSAYTSASNKAVRAGGVVHVREEWTDSTSGEKSHKVSEYRVDPEHGDLGKINAALTGLACGSKVTVEIGTIESASGKTWRNLVSVERVAAVKAA